MDQKKCMYNCTRKNVILNEYNISAHLYIYIYIYIYIYRRVFKAIPRGVFKRLAKLTTKTPKNANTPLDQLYPRHAKTLKNANLHPPKYPSINEVNEETETRKKLKEAKFEKSYHRKTPRDIFFCIGYSDSWSSPIHKII